MVRGSVSLASQQIRLAWWMKERYGSTMNQALKTVLPVKQQVRQKEKKVLKCLLSREELELAVAEAARKHYKARETAFTGIYRDGRDSIRDGDRADESDCRIHETSGGERNHFRGSRTMYRNPEISGNGYKTAVSLNPAQKAVGRRF